MDKLAPKLIRRAAKKDYVAIIIDPIYKVITGDENSADQMANFCNQFDKVCTELGCAVIYCHHHSKGSQGNKRSMDRASGSGVFARDPDALLDLIELEPTESLLKQEEDKAVCSEIKSWITGKWAWEDDLSDDDLMSRSVMMSYREKLPSYLRKSWDTVLMPRLNRRAEEARRRTAWRIEGTLREFQKFEPVNLWFDYPIHKLDEVGSLKDIGPEEEKPLWQKAIEKRKTPAQRKSERRKALEAAMKNSNYGEEPSLADLAEYLGISERAARDRVKEHGDFIIEDGVVKKKT
jgi:hypothetical protein